MQDYRVFGEADHVSFRNKPQESIQFLTCALHSFTSKYRYVGYGPWHDSTHRSARPAVESLCCSDCTYYNAGWCIYYVR
eukprot:scaffold21936_cov50-Attheya_sp.AAC.1